LRKKEGERGELHNNQQNGEKSAAPWAARKKQATVTYRDGQHFGEYLILGDLQFL
jgi:hypothetical protein